MFRMWAKIFKNNHMLKDMTVVNDNPDMTRTKKVLKSLEDICYEFDLGTPIWLECNISEFKRIAGTRFRADNFIESIDFDFLEIQVIEEDGV